MILYHFTALLHLPRILKEGITKGELPYDKFGIKPFDPFDIRPTGEAANLTTEADLDCQKSWIRSDNLWKERIRLTVEIPKEEVTTFGAFAEKYKLTREWLETLGPPELRKVWFLAFGGVKVEQIRCVDLLEKNTYRALSHDETIQLVCAITVESEKFDRFFALNGFETWWLKPGSASSWLLEDEREKDFSFVFQPTGVNS